MRFLIITSLILASTSSVQAQGIRRRATTCANCPTYQYTTAPTYTYAQPPTYTQAQPTTYQAAQPATYQPAQSYTGGYPDTPDGFLSALNAYRAQCGRGPVGWDGNLAAAASTNNIAGHAPHSMAGSGQCWASGFSYLSALYRWIASPSHNAILLNATSAIGCSPCASGMTLNAR